MTALVLLAAGLSRRYGGIKLLDEMDGKKMYLYALELAEKQAVQPCIAVTAYEEIKAAAKSRGMKVVWNASPELGISNSLKLGLLEVKRCLPEADGVLFLVCDQPYLKKETVSQMLRAFESMEKPEKSILCPVPEGGSFSEAGNPCIIGRDYFDELLLLEGDTGGKQVIRRHPEAVCLFPVKESRELLDIDTKGRDEEPEEEKSRDCGQGL